MINKKNIWNFAQNKPSLIVNDLKKFGVPENEAHKILLIRGVYKWLAVRRHIIKLKNTWKNRITDTISKITYYKQKQDAYRIGYYRGYLKAYEECRKEIRTLCHSDRWQAPDFDEAANKYLQSIQ
jgi:hypothetical protein